MQRMNNPNYSAKVIHGEYYPHIDGIRALAVLPVVFFHVLACLCPGGFAGVDVFFVISGYLITGGILRDLEQDRFTIRNFYHRRIRRIMPAYFALIAGVFATGCAIYYSTPLIHLGDASVMGTLFSANLYFWKMGGDYFAPDVHQNPLLHLWSLSVEEQFYLFIPLLCAMVWKFRRAWVFPIFSAIAVFSLGASIYAVATGKQSSAFYLLHFRAWELLAGSLLAMMPRLGTGSASVPVPAFDVATSVLTTLPTPGTGTAAEPVPKITSAPPTSDLRPQTSVSPLRSPAFLASLGLLMVLIPYVALSSKTPFPGLAALSSVLGTALLIRYGSTGWVSRLLSWRPFVATGKISYSLYLWHWPVTVFWKYATYDQLYWFDYVGMFLLSFLLGYLSWKFVELPVRTSQKWTLRRSFAFAASGIVLLVGLGVACVFSRGWPTLLHPKANQFVDNSQTAQFVESWLRNSTTKIYRTLHLNIKCQSQVPLWASGNGIHQLGKPERTDIFILGDSHASVLLHGLDVVLQEKGYGAKSISQFGKNMFDQDTDDYRKAIEMLTRLPHVSKVLLVQSWASPRNNNQDIYTPLSSFSTTIHAMGKTLYIVAAPPRWQNSPGDIRARMEIIPPRKMKNEWSGSQPNSTYEQDQGNITRELKKICCENDAVFIPLHLAFYQKNHFVAFNEQDNASLCFYKDDNHLSKHGSLHAARFIFPLIFPTPASDDVSKPNTPNP